MASQTKPSGQRARASNGTRDSEANGPFDDPRPLRGYGVLLGGYGAFSAALALASRRRAKGDVSLRPGEVALFALATMHLSRLITKDSIASVLRAPFTRFEEATGEGEVNEAVVGTGLRHAVGELITCPFCLGQWIATALVAGRVLAPRATRALVAICALARLSDVLQLSYERLREAASPAG